MLIPHQHSPTGDLTVSVGVSTLKPDTKTYAQTLVRLADDALYLAKHRGRNQVVAYSDIDAMRATKQTKPRIKLVLRSDPAA